MYIFLNTITLNKICICTNSVKVAIWNVSNGPFGMFQMAATGKTIISANKPQDIDWK